MSAAARTGPAAMTRDPLALPEYHPLEIPPFLRRRPGDTKAPGERPRAFNHAKALSRAKKRRSKAARKITTTARIVKTKALAVWHGTLTTSEALDALERAGLDHFRAQGRLCNAIERLNRKAAS